MIVFIDPIPDNLKLHTPTNPLQLVEVASYIKNNQPEIPLKIISIALDYGYPLTENSKAGIYQRLINDLKWMKPIGIGISCTATSMAKEVLNLCDIIKIKLPNSFLFLGGYFPTLYYREILETAPSVDSVVIGEGEKPAFLIAKYLHLKKDPRRFNLPGMAYKQDGNIIANKSKERFDLKKKLPLNIDIIKDLNSNDFLPYAFSRGCSFRCHFCMEDLIRPKRQAVPDKIIKQDLETLKKVLNYKHILVSDPMFKSFYLLELIKKLKARISFETRCDVLSTNELINIAKTKVCNTLGLGFESASYSSLLRMNKVKNFTHYKRYINNAKKLFKTAVHYNIPILMTILLGYPGDTKEDIKQTYNFLAELSNIKSSAGFFFHVSQCKAFYKTKTYNMALSLKDVCFEDNGFLGDNTIKRASKDLSYDNIIEYSYKIKKLSKLRPKILKYIYTAHPFYGLPNSAFKSRILPSGCFKDKNREILDISQNKLCLLKKILPLLHIKNLLFS